MHATLHTHNLATDGFRNYCFDSFFLTKEKKRNVSLHLLAYACSIKITIIRLWNPAFLVVWRYPIRIIGAMWDRWIIAAIIAIIYGHMVSHYRTRTSASSVISKKVHMGFECKRNAHCLNFHASIKWHNRAMVLWSIRSRYRTDNLKRYS